MLCSGKWEIDEDTKFLVASHVSGTRTLEDTIALFIVDLLDIMLSSLVEILEEKGILTQEEWEKHIKEKVTVR